MERMQSGEVSCVEALEDLSEGNASWPLMGFRPGQRKSAFMATRLPPQECGASTEIAESRFNRGVADCAQLCRILQFI